MVDEKKVIMMTRMASYEEGKGREDIRIGRYFRGDFVASALIKAFFAAAFSGISVIAIYIFYNFEDFMQNIYELDLLMIFKQFGTYFLRFLIGYMIIAYIVCMIKFFMSKSNIDKYKRNLKKLSKLNKAQEK